MSPRHVLAAVAVAVVWGVNFVVIHVGLGSAPPLLLAALRFTLVAALCAWWVPRPALPVSRLLALGLFVYVGQFGLLFTAMGVGMSPGLAAVVMQSQAVFTVALASVLLKEKPSGAQALGVAVASAGLVLIGVDRVVEGGASSSVTGFLLCLGAGLSWAFGNLVARRSGTTQGLGLVVWGSVVAAPVLLVAAAVEVGPTRLLPAVAAVDVPGMLALAYLTVLATIFGFGIWSSLVSRYPAAVVTPFTMLVPPVGLVTAWLALGETVPVLSLVGSALVVGGLLVPQVRGMQDRARTARAVREAPAVAG